MTVAAGVVLCSDYRSSHGWKSPVARRSEAIVSVLLEAQLTLKMACNAVFFV